MAVPLAVNAPGRTGQLHGGVHRRGCATSFARPPPARRRPTTRLDGAGDGWYLHVRYSACRLQQSTVRATATVVTAGRTLIVVAAEVTDSEGRLVATADFCAMLVPTADRSSGRSVRRRIPGWPWGSLRMGRLDHVHTSDASRTGPRAAAWYA